MTVTNEQISAVDSMLSALEHHDLPRTGVNWRLAILVAYYSGWDAIAAKDGTLARLLFKSFGCSEITISKVTNARKQLVKRGLLGCHKHDPNFLWILPRHERSVEKTKGFFLWTESETASWLERNAANINRVLPNNQTTRPDRDVQRIVSVAESETRKAIEDVSDAIKRFGPVKLSPIATFVASVAGYNWLKISVNMLWESSGRLVEQRNVKNALSALRRKRIIDYCDADPNRKSGKLFLRVMPDVTPSQTLFLVEPQDTRAEAFPLFDGHGLHPDKTQNAEREASLSHYPITPPCTLTKVQTQPLTNRIANKSESHQDELIRLIDERFEVLLAQKRLVVSFGNHDGGLPLAEVTPPHEVRTYSTDEIETLFGKGADWISRQKKDKDFPFPKPTNGNKRPQVYLADEVDRLMSALAVRKKST